MPLTKFQISTIKNQLESEDSIRKIVENAGSIEEARQGLAAVSDNDLFNIINNNPQFYPILPDIRRLHNFYTGDPKIIFKIDAKDEVQAEITKHLQNRGNSLLEEREKRESALSANPQISEDIQSIKNIAKLLPGNPDFFGPALKQEIKDFHQNTPAVPGTNRYDIFTLNELEAIHSVIANDPDLATVTKEFTRALAKKQVAATPQFPYPPLQSAPAPVLPAFNPQFQASLQPSAPEDDETPAPAANLGPWASMFAKKQPPAATFTPAVEDQQQALANRRNYLASFLLGSTNLPAASTPKVSSPSVQVLPTPTQPLTKHNVKVPVPGQTKTNTVQPKAPVQPQQKAQPKAIRNVAKDCGLEF